MIRPEFNLDEEDGCCQLPGTPSGRNRPCLYIPGFSENDSYIQITQQNTPNGFSENDSYIQITQQNTPNGFSENDSYIQITQQNTPNGFSENDSYIQITQQNTPNGPLGEEITSKDQLRIAAREEPDSGLESSFSMLSIADDSYLHQRPSSRPSVGLNTAQISVLDLDNSSEENVETSSDKSLSDNVTSVCRPPNTSFVCTYDTSEVSVSEICQHENTCGVCDECQRPCNKSKLMTSGKGFVCTYDTSADPVSDTCHHENSSGVCNECSRPCHFHSSCESLNLHQSLQSDTNDCPELAAESLHSHVGTDVIYQEPIQKEILSFPFPNIFSVPGSGPTLKTINNDSKLNRQSVKAFEKSSVKISEAMFKKTGLLPFQSPSKYKQGKYLSPSEPKPLNASRVECMCVSTQTGHQGNGDNGYFQYLPALDGRTPGSPLKERGMKATYLSPIQSRTTEELWEDIVHSSEQKYKETAPCFVNHVACQTESVPISKDISNDGIEFENSLSGHGDGVPQNYPAFQNNVSFERDSATLSKSTGCSKPDRKISSQKNLRRLFSELPITSQSDTSSNMSDSQNSFSTSVTPLPSTPVQERKRIKAYNEDVKENDGTRPKGRAIRKTHYAPSTSQTKKAKVRAARPKRNSSDVLEMDQNQPSIACMPVAMESSPCGRQNSATHHSVNLSTDSIDVVLDVKTSTPVKYNSQRIPPQNPKKGNPSGNSPKQTEGFFSPLMSSTSDDISMDDSGVNYKGRQIRASGNNQGVTSPQLSSPTPVTLNISADIKLSPSDLDTLTKIHTICNGQRLVEYVKCSDSPMILTHYPPPKAASRIQWRSELEEEVDEPAPPSPVIGPKSHTPKPILTQRAEDFRFPYSDESPSPILLTKTRKQNILSQITQHTQL